MDDQNVKIFDSFNIIFGEVSKLIKPSEQYLFTTCPFLLVSRRPPYMALIEYLEHDNWREALRRSFEGAILLRSHFVNALLQTDRFRLTSSAIDDVRSWLTNGGVSRVQLQLDREMKGRRLDSDRQREIRDFLRQLVQENQHPLVQLIADGIIPWNQADFLATCGISGSEFDAMWEQISTGANPFETWMLANGYSQERIDPIYQIIDRWLVKTELSLPRHPDDPLGTDCLILLTGTSLHKLTEHLNIRVVANSYRL